MKQGAFLLSNNSQYFQFHLIFVAGECMQDSPLLGHVCWRQQLYKMTDVPITAVTTLPPPPSRQTLVSVTTPAVFSLLITSRGQSDTLTVAHHFNQAQDRSAKNVSWSYK